MRKPRPFPFCLLVFGLSFFISQVSAQSAASWTTWGGPNHNFTVRDAGLAEQWPASGPTKLWSRELGEGYSPIAVHEGVLFTMFRRNSSHESAIAIDAATGKTLWEHQYEMSPSGMALENGPGPHMMPVVAGGRVFVIGITGKMHCLDEKTGKVEWSHNLVADFNSQKMDRGYGNTPLPYKDMLLLPIGAKGASIIALKQNDGSTAWKNTDSFANAYSSPLPINVAGEEQVVFFLGNEIAGIAPATGKTLWKFAHKTDWGLNISTPLWDGNLLFMSSAYGGGSRVLRLDYAGGVTNPSEVWFSRKLRIHIGDAIRKGNYVIGSSGDFGPSFLVAIDVNTGEEAWRDRTLSRANMILAGTKLILVDEDGHLVLAKPDAKGLNVVSKAEILQHNAWTAPSLVGTKLYVRDRAKITAFDLR